VTDWEQQYQQNDTPWDKGAPAPPLVDFLETEPLTGRILVPGCGAGHDVRAIAAASPEAEVIGLDVAPSAIAKANGFPKAGRESYHVGDLFQLGAEFQESFDFIWEHTCFCAIEPEMREAYVTATRQCLKLGGELLGVFYLDPYDDEHRPEDGRPPHGIMLPDLLDLMNTVYEVEDYWTPDRAFPGREDREILISLRRL